MFKRLKKLKKIKGFTLIELLAVITVLAIIALITIPIVSNSISESRKSSALRSAELYIDAVDKALANRDLDGNFAAEEGWYSINRDGNVCLSYNYCSGDAELIVTAKNKPTSGMVYIRENGVDGVTDIVYGDYIVSSGPGGKLMVYEPNAVNFDSMCTRQLDNDGYDTITCGTESFYVMGEDSNTVTMLAKYNLDVGYIATSYGNAAASSNNLSPTVATPVKEIGGDDDWVLTPIQNPTGLQKEEARGYVDGLSSYYGVVPYVSNSLHEGTINMSDILKGANIKIENQSSTGNKLVAKPVVKTDYETTTCNTTNYTYLDNDYMRNYVEDYESYLRNNGVTSAQARLMSVDELDYLLDYSSFDGGSGGKKSKGQFSNSNRTLAGTNSISNIDWLFSTSYWLGSGNYGCEGELAVKADDDYDFISLTTQEYYGVRPVIVVDKSEINVLSSGPYIDFSGIDIESGSGSEFHAR